MFRQLLLLIAILGLCSNLKAQDPAYTQFYASPVFINPAFTGTTMAPRISLVYRNQWASLTNAYTTYSAAYEQFVDQLNSGFGASLMVDDQGDGLVRTTFFKALYSYQLTITDGYYVKIGVEAGLTQANYAWDRFTFPDQLDKLTGAVDPLGNPNLTAEIRPDDTNATYFDIGSGLLAYSKYFYAGLALKHLSRPNDGIIRINDELTDGLPLMWSAQLGTQINFNEGNNRNRRSFISPNLMFLKQADYGQINAGVYGGMSFIFAGAWYRHAFSNPDAIMFLIGVQQGIIKVGYSYDMTVSELAVNPSGGAHEISLILNFENSESFKRQRRAKQYNDCMQLFR